MKLLKRTDVTYIYVTVVTFDPYAVRSVFLALQSIPNFSNKPMKMAQKLMVFLWPKYRLWWGGRGLGVGCNFKGISPC